MRVQFMVEDNERYLSDMPYEIVESYCSPEYPHHGYDIYQVETDNISSIRVVNETSGIEYKADEAMYCTDGRGAMFYVSIWSPVEEAENEKRH